MSWRGKKGRSLEIHATHRDDDKSKAQVEQKSKKVSEDIPKVLTVYFYILHFCLGFDFGFEKSFREKYRKYVRWHATVVWFLYIVFLTSPILTFGYHLRFWTSLAQCTMYFVRFKVFTLKYTVYDLLQAVHQLKDDIPGINEERFGIIMMVYAVSWAFVYITALITRLKGGLYSHPMFKQFFGFYRFAIFAVDYLVTVQIIIYYYIWCHVKAISDALKQGNDDTSLKECARKYKTAYAIFSSIRHLYSYIIITELITKIPEILIHFWDLFISLYDKTWFSYFSNWIRLFRIFTQFLVPSVLVYKVGCLTADIIKMLSARRLKNAPNKKTYYDIDCLIEYINLRPMQYYVWGAIPTDIRLPFRLISFIVTYFIVIIQLSNFY